MPEPALGHPEGAGARTVAALADEYVAAYLEQYPERAALAGLPLSRSDRLTDNSLDALATWQAREDAWADALAAVDVAELRGSAVLTIHGLLEEALASSRRTRLCRYELWPVNHLTGWQAELVQLADDQPLGTPAARDEAIARWSELPRYLETEVDNLREGLRRGYTTPRRSVELVIAQLDDLLASPVDSWSLAGPGARADDEAFATRWRRLLTDSVGPAIERYHAFLRHEYVARARETLAITALPDGEAIYHAAFRGWTTVERSGAETFARGSERVEANLEEAVELGRRALGTVDAPALIARIHGDRDNRFESRQALLDFATDAVTRASSRLDRWFRDRPAAEVRIEPYPAHLERDAVDDSYWPASEDGSRPARYLIPAYHFAAATRSNAEITAFHEAYPGHHLQIGIAQRLAAHPIAHLLPNAGFTEGWARYAEALAEEMGLYTSTFALAGRRLWPCRGMVVDPGIHLFGWSRERAAAFMTESGRMTADEADQTVDRIAVLPGQFTAYDTGGLEFFALRAKAETALGNRFDIRAFHDAVLRNGSVTLPMLRAQVDDWIGGG